MRRNRREKEKRELHASRKLEFRIGLRLYRERKYLFQVVYLLPFDPNVSRK